MYTSIYYERPDEHDQHYKSYIHIFDDEFGYKKIPYKKYAYKLDPKGEFRSLFDQPLKKVFRWSKQDEENGLIFEGDVSPEMRYLIDNYPDSEEPSKSHIELNFDIEVEVNEGLPDPQIASNEITAIAYYEKNKKTYTALIVDSDNKLKELKTKDSEGLDVNVLPFSNEKDLLQYFLIDYKRINPTILTGWNCVSLNTHVWKENEICNITELKYGDTLFDSEINAILPTSVKKSNKIILTNGQYINSSKEHIFPIIIKEKNKYTDFTTNNGIVHTNKSVSDIIKLNYNENNEIYFKVPIGKNNNNNKKNKSEIDIDNEVFYILGLIYTDGSKSDKSCCIYNSNDEIINSCFNFKESYKQVIREGDGIYVDKRSNTSKTSRIRFWLSEYNPLTEVIDYIYNEEGKKEININKLSKISHIQFQYFLSGIIDGDGCLSGEHITLCNYNNDIDIYKLQELILWNGYISNVHDNTLLIPKKQKNTKIPLYLKSTYKKEIYDKIEFINSVSKSNKIKYRFNDLENCFYVKLDKIEETQNTEEMIDISTNTHYFIGNAIKTHNCDNFDIPYLYNRIRNVFGEDIAHKLSPIDIVKFNPYRNRYFIAGVSCLDYMSIYKVFITSERASFSLDAISKLEIGEGKLQFQGTLQQLYESDIQKYVEYNIHDVRLVKKIDDKMNLIELAKGIVHKGRVPLEDIYYSSRYLDGAILSYLRRFKKIAPNKPQNDYDFENNTEDKFSGAYVKIPVPGKYEWVYDLDLTSMYPSIIRSLNISPETKITKIENWDVNKFVSEDDETEFQIKVDKSTRKLTAKSLKKMLSETKMSISSNGVLYETDIPGVIPSILETWFNERVEMKDKMKEYGKKGNDELYNYYDLRQKVQKVLLNSLYGVLGLPVFRFFDLDNAEAVTTTGVDLIKFSEKIVNSYYNEELGTKDVDHVIYIDTDSVDGNSIVKSKEYGDIKIKDLFDKYSYLNTIINKNYDNREWVFPKKLSLPFFDETNKKIKYGKVEFIEKHSIKKRMFKITLKNKKSVIVTEDHSCMIYQNNKLIEKKAKDLNKKDIVVSLK